MGLDELEAMVSRLLESNKGARSVAASSSSIREVKKLSVGEGRRFTAAATGARSVATSAEEDPVEVYEFSIGNAGDEAGSFVLASNDDRIGNILAIAEGTTDHTSVLNNCGSPF